MQIADEVDGERIAPGIGGKAAEAKAIVNRMLVTNRRPLAWVTRRIRPAPLLKKAQITEPKKWELRQGVAASSACA
ncbi:hypothetical protein [Ensifer sesbaniae]|uniref:hypothetical protein n=1 Tax=Ensifer sesbaniae TaxID=1214071 RepID=UPI001567C7C2|nr:hypothetical protein [Ensifer sesbaniae]NRQ17271.1 hypothetical protein [Ensifer sesbaniae]